MDPLELEPELEALHEQSFAWALRCCGGNHSEAEDVLQTTYLKILEGRARFGAKSSLKTWLFSVIRKTAAGRLRRGALRDRLLARFGRDEPTPGPEPDAVVAQSESRARVTAAVDQLSARQAELVDLVFYHDLSVSDAAGVLGISVGSARQHYARAKKRLASALGRKDDA